MVKITKKTMFFATCLIFLDYFLLNICFLVSVVMVTMLVLWFNLFNSLGVVAPTFR